jgi:hypothetical protein
MKELYKAIGMRECPVCGGMMTDIAPDGETEGQLAERLAGNCITYQCQSCGEIMVVEK